MIEIWNDYNVTWYGNNIQKEKKCIYSKITSMAEYSPQPRRPSSITLWTTEENNIISCRFLQLLETF